MKKSKNHRTKYVLALAGLVLVSAMNLQPAKASEQADVKVAGVHTTNEEGIVALGKGDANLVISGNTDQSLKGKKFRIHRIFAEENSDKGESVNYSFVPEYEEALKTVASKKLGKTLEEMTEYVVVDYIQSLNHFPAPGAASVPQNESRYSDFRYFIEDLRNEISKSQVKGEVITVNGTKQDNSIEVTGLPYGYYIVDEVSEVKDQHSAASLCMVNTANPSTKMNIKSDYPNITKKIQEDDNRVKIGNEGWNDIGDFEIGQVVPYQFHSDIPDISGYQTYYYAWHDRMDEALSFRPDSVKIKIKDAQEGKTYTLSKEEYQVLENPGQSETFMIEVQNIKAIIDTQFYRGESRTDQKYGQQIELSYEAVLNDKAALKTGRPGFENDVQLEFSNNPDSDGVGSTGRTPWDTVVCFTYKLNGIKQNEDQVALSGAEFALYRDLECSREVYVKKTEAGYIVMNEDTAGSSRPKQATSIVSDETGEFSVAGLDGGVYYLKELKAPTGYRKIKNPIKLEVIPTFTQERNSYIKGDGALEQTLISLEYTAYVKQFLRGLFKEDTLNLQTDAGQGAGNLTVVNYKGRKLPVTGSSVTLILMLGSALVGAAAFVLRKKKVKTDEE